MIIGKTFDGKDGIKVGILLLILEEAKKKYPNYYVTEMETIENRYTVTFSSTFGHLSGQAFSNEYRIEDGKAVFVRNVMQVRS